MKRSKTVEGVRGEYQRARNDPAKLQTLMGQWGRERLAHELPKWRPLLMATNKDGLARVTRGDEGIILEFRWDDLRQTLSPENYAIVDTLYHELMRQANVADCAVEIACTKLANVKQNAEAGQKGGKAGANRNRIKVEQLMRAQLVPQTF